MFNGSSKGGPCIAGWDQLRLPWTVRGDHFWRGTIDGVTGRRIPHERERFLFAAVFSRSAGRGGSVVFLCVFCAV